MAATFEPKSHETFTVGSIKFVQAGNLKALVDVRFGPLTISGWRIIGQPGQRVYVSAPQSQYTDRVTGQTKYAPLVVCEDQAFANSIKSAILQAYQRQTHTTPSSIFTDDEEVLA